MRKALCLIFFQALAFASSSLGTQSTPTVPELPRLSLDTFSPGIQRQIREADSYARSHPGDAAASGRLDLFVANYLDFTVKGNKHCYAATGERDYCTPKMYQPTPARLFHNR